MIFLTCISVMCVFKAARIALASYSEGAASAAKFARSGAWGQNPKNLARDMMRRVLRDVTMPDLFWYQIPTWNHEARQQELTWHPFLLPHEMIHHIVQKDSSWLHLSAALYPETHDLLENSCSKFHTQQSKTAGIGLHGDGVPYTKKDSVEILSLNFLGFPTADRIPITCISKKYLCKCGCKGIHTWYKILEVIVWSFKMLMVGYVSSYLPNREVWEQAGNLLASGTKLAAHAFVLQVRGDWPFLKTLFSFPQHNELRGLCWQCLASGIEGSVLTFKKTGLNALWRKHRLTCHEFVESLRTANLPVSPLLSLPGFSCKHVVLDWLHVVDLGCAADMLGNLFWQVISTSNLLLVANSKAHRLDLLWAKLQGWYKVTKPAARLDNLTEEMIKAGEKPKLRAKGAECRYLLCFGAEVACELAEKQPNTHNTTVATLFTKLVLLQRLVSGSLAYNFETAATVCRQACVLYTALHESMVASHKPKLWDLKPKLHLLQEMVEYQSYHHGNPRNFWCYRDESWCGFWARAAKRRGGANSAAMTPERFLQRYRALEEL